MTDKYKTRRTLLVRVQDQYDDNSWSEFSEIYKNYIYIIIRRMGIREQDAEDIMQKVMLELWKMLPRLEPDEIRRFRSYLSGITRNCVLKFIRGQKKQHENEVDIDLDDNFSRLEGMELPEIEEIAQREWEMYITSLALERLERHFTGQAVNVFTLSSQGRSIEDIAEELGLTQKTVYNLRYKVKQRLTHEISQLRVDLE